MCKAFQCHDSLPRAQELSIFSDILVFSVAITVSLGLVVLWRFLYFTCVALPNLSGENLSK